MAISPGPLYMPAFFMPLIGPPPVGTAPETHYATVNADTILTVTPAPNEAVTILLSNPARAGLFAMAGGEIQFIPPGSPLPTPGLELSPGEGTLVLNLWVADVTELTKSLPSGVPAMTQILYQNVNEALARAALGPEVLAIPEAALRASWATAYASSPPSGISVTDLATDHLDRVMRGEATVFVSGGTPLGEAALVNSAVPANGAQFTLRFLDGAVPKTDLSPIGALRGMASYGGAQWTGHPLVEAVRNTPRPVDIYVRFEVWQSAPVSPKHIPLPAGVEVDLVDYDPVIPNTTLLTERTNAAGEVHFHIPNMQALDEDEPDLFCVVRAAGVSHAGHTLPDQWSTKGWKAVDGKPGYYENFTGVQIGRADDPVVFRIGLDIHLALEYQRPSSFVNPRATSRVLVEVHADNIPNASWETDNKGEIHGVLFDVRPDQTISFAIPFEMTDPSINLPTARVYLPPWETVFLPDQKIFPNIDETSIGSDATPEIATARTDNRNVAFYFLKILRELQTFLYSITDGDWTGVNNLVLGIQPLTPNSYSWPPGVVQIVPAHHWERATLVHEISHQVVWKQADYSEFGIALEALPFGDLLLYHHAQLLSNNEHAFIEGWPELLETIFAGPAQLFYGSRTPPSTFNPLDPFSPPYDDVFDSSFIPVGKIGPPPLNRGEEVEGALAIALLRVYRNFVVAGADPTGQIPETTADGNIRTTAPWVIDAGVRARFASMIWEPLKDLAALANPTSTQLMQNIRTSNWAQWHRIRQDLNLLRIAMAVPTLRWIIPSSGPAGAANSAIIDGTAFVEGLTVDIGGRPAMSVSVVSSVQLDVLTPPLPAGTYDVVVTTLAGSALLAAAYTAV